MDRPTCETCPFWDVENFGHEEGWGECHRYPPRVAQTEEQQQLSRKVDPSVGILVGWFPETGAGHWCGEHPAFPAYLKACRARAHVTDWDDLSPEELERIEDTIVKATGSRPEFQ